MLFTKFFHNSCLFYKFRTCNQETDKVITQRWHSTKLHGFILKVKFGKCYIINPQGPKQNSFISLCPFSVRKMATVHHIPFCGKTVFWKTCFCKNTKNLTRLPMNVFGLKLRNNTYIILKWKINLLLGVRRQTPCRQWWKSSWKSIPELGHHFVKCVLCLWNSS